MDILRKHSKKRDAILKALCSTKTHPTAQWIYENVRNNIPDLSLATVYRNLKQLKNDGLVISVGVVDKEERFDGFVAPHPHFVCENCGCVFDLEYQENNFLKEFITDKAYRIDFKKTTFYGLCKNCIN